MPSHGTKGHESVSAHLSCCLVFWVVDGGGGVPSSPEHCWLPEIKGIYFFLLLLFFLPYTKTRQFCMNKPISFLTMLSLHGAEAGLGSGVCWWESPQSSP